MKLIYRFLTQTKNVMRSAYIWNMIVQTANAFQTVILLMLLTRSGDLTGAAIFTIAYTVANTLLYIGKYSIRQFQVSDVNNEYTYGEYRSARKVTIAAMILAAVGYLVYSVLFREYTVYKCVCLILLVAFRLIESVEDLFHGDLQKHERLDIASKIWTIRIVAYMICFAVVYLITEDLLTALAVALIPTLLLYFLLNRAVADLFPRENSCSADRVKKLLQVCFPIAASTVLMIYISNTPKYAVDAVLTSEEQTGFNVVFLPVFVISLLGGYLYNPIIGKMADAWQEGKKKELARLTRMNALLLLGLTAVVIAGGCLIGLRILELLYRVDLSGYTLEFTLLMLAGGFLALYNFLTVLATVMRRQKMLLYISAVTALCLAAGSRRSLILAGTKGMCVFYAVMMMAMALVTLCRLARELRSGK